jgi:crotonobetainyl-CoA:carnitine CoA-transferase CaiB-like acyl-CoA transferase
MMRNRQDSDRVPINSVDQAKGKSAHDESPVFLALRRRRQWVFLDEREAVRHLIEKLIAQAGALTVV